MLPKDGNSSTDYLDLVEKVYKADPIKYVHVAFKYFNGDLSCAVHLVANEASNIDAVSIATKASDDHSNDVKLRKFIKLLKQQSNAIKVGLSSDYLDCK